MTTPRVQTAGLDPAMPPLGRTALGTGRRRGIAVVLHFMRRRGGVIIDTASVLGTAAFRGTPVHTASKAAMIGSSPLPCGRHDAAAERPACGTQTSLLSFDEALRIVGTFGLADEEAMNRRRRASRRKGRPRTGADG